MDIEEAKKFAKNKIEADAITKQVRDIIKITKWQKQDMREGFKETFKPLIESQDNIKKSIDDKQNATLAQLQANQLAITQALNQIRLVINKVIAKDTSADTSADTSEGNISDFDKYLLNKESIDILNKNRYYNLPSEYHNTDEITINKLLYNIDLDLQDIKNELNSTANFTKDDDGYILLMPKNEDIDEESLKKIDEFNVLSTYYKNLVNVKNDIKNRKIN